MDKLERFVKENRQNFDSHQPKEYVWDAICQTLNKSAFSKSEQADLPASKQVKMIFSKRSWRVAAASVFLLVSSLTAYIYFFQYKPKQLAEQMDLTEIVPELAEAEGYYIALINQKMQLLKEYPKSYKPEEVLKEISTLDSIYHQMKPDLLSSFQNEKIVSSMIHNLQIRIDLLNKQLFFLEQLKKEKKQNSQSHETDIDI